MAKKKSFAEEIEELTRPAPRSGRFFFDSILMMAVS
jgi:hypothetical protein